MSDQPNIKLPLERLFLQLETAGFKMDTARKLRILKAVNERGHLHLGDFESLKFLLAPLVATSDREQRRFYDLFEAFWESCNIELDIPAKPSVVKRKGSQWKYWWVFPFISLLFCIPIIKNIISPSKIEPKTIIDFDKSNLSLVREGDSIFLGNLSRNVEPSHLYWELEKEGDSHKEIYKNYDLKWKAGKYLSKWKITLLYDDSIFHVNDQSIDEFHSHEFKVEILKNAYEDNLGVSHTFTIHCANPLQLQEKTFPQKIEVHKSYPFEIKTDKTAGIEWYFPNGDTLSGNRVNHAFEEQGIKTIRGKIYRKGEKEYCYSTFSEDVTVGTNKPFIKYADYIIDKPDANFGLANWMWWLFALPLLGAAWMLWRWWNDRQEDDQAEKTTKELMETYPVNDQAPYYIPYLPQDEKISVPAEFYRMSEILRRREESERMSFDPNRSVKATIESGGFPSWRERAITNPTDYLFLVERESERDQQGRLFERLTTFFKKQDVPVAVYFHDGNFRSFWNDEQPDGVSLEYLNKQYLHHRLVLLGDGHRLINPYDTREPTLLNGTLNQLLRWKRRLLLTPSAASGWSYQEALLYRHFFIYPTDTEGVLEGLAEMDWTDEYEPGAFTSHERNQNEFRTDQTERYHTWDTVEEHREFLKNDPECFRWLCGLATTSHPDFALTVAIGRSLGIEVTHDRLLRLTRISWLSSNEPNEKLRMQFLLQLTENEEIITRKAALEELKKIEATVKGGFAEAEWTATAALHKFALDPRDEAYKETIRDLMQLGLLTGAQTEELNWIVDHKIEDKELPAGTEKTIEGWLTVSADKPFFNQKMIWAIALAALSLLLFGLGYTGHQNLKNAEYETAPFWVGSFDKENPAVIANNDGVEAALPLLADTAFHLKRDQKGDEWIMEWPSFFVNNRSKAIGKFLDAKRLRAPAAYTVADTNYLAANYNYYAQLFNFYLKDSLPKGTFAPTPILVEIKEATDFFNAKSSKLEKIEGVDSLKTAMIHLSGLASYYLEYEPDLQTVAIKNKAYKKDRKTTLAAYNEILKRDRSFFDKIRNEMPINLQTLITDAGILDPPSYWLRAVVMGDDGKVVPNATLSMVGLNKLQSNTNGMVDFEFIVIPSRTSLSGRITARGYEKQDFSIIARTTEKRDTIILRKEVVKTIPYTTEKKPIEQKDTDGDGILDIKDTCPTEAGTKENNGCPAAGNLVTLIVRAFFGKTELSDVSIKLFEFNNGKARLIATEKFKGKNCPPIKAVENRTYIIEASKLGYQVAKDTFVVENYNPVEGGVLAGSTKTIEMIPVKTIAFKEPQMIQVKGGTFTMGCTAEQGEVCSFIEKPKHKVTVSDFAIGKYEVTNEEFADFLNDRGNQIEGGKKWVEIGGKGYGEKCRIIEKSSGKFTSEKGFEKHPLIFVTWFGARAYCKWLSERTGEDYRLPTEAEWEYAARGGSKGKATKYSGSENVDAVAWYTSTSDDKGTKVVGTKKPNELGIYDMSGNAYEWCFDWYGNYSSNIQSNPRGPEIGELRVLRGGSWYYNYFVCRVSNRGNDFPHNANSSSGFRVARR